MKVICGIIVAFGVFMMLGTAGAIETGSITIRQGDIRLAWIIPMTIAAFVFMKKYDRR